jgi:hypothetical protein
VSQTISDLFEIVKGDHIAIARMQPSDAANAVPVVARGEKNNGVAVCIDPLPSREPFESGLLTVSLGGSVLATFVQPAPFYTAHNDIAVLYPKAEMTLHEKLWRGLCIRANKYRYNYGRQANRTLAELELPDEIPDWIGGAFNNYLKTLTALLGPGTHQN